MTDEEILYELEIIMDTEVTPAGAVHVVDPGVVNISSPPPPPDDAPIPPKDLGLTAEPIMGILTPYANCVSVP